MLKSRGRGWREEDIWRSQSQNLWRSQVSEARGAVDCLPDLHSTLLLVGDVGSLKLMHGRFPCSEDSEWELGPADYTCLRFGFGRQTGGGGHLTFISGQAVLQQHCTLLSPGSWVLRSSCRSRAAVGTSGLWPPRPWFTATGVGLEPIASVRASGW